MSKFILSLLVCFSSGVVNAAGMSLICKRNSQGFSCAERVVSALDKLGCHPNPASVICEDAESSPRLDPSYAGKMKGKEFCYVQSICREPSYGLFGGVSCSGEELDLSDVDSKITLTVSVGLFRSYVTTICK